MNIQGRQFDQEIVNWPSWIINSSLQLTYCDQFAIALILMLVMSDTVPIFSFILTTLQISL